VSEKAIEFVKKLLTPNPDERPNAKQALEDAWIQENGISEIDLGQAYEVFTNLRKFRSGNEFKKACY